MEKQMVFSSTTAKARFFIMQYVSKDDREYERRELVEYVYKMAGSDENMTDGVIAGAVKMLTYSGELITVKRGIFRKGASKMNANSFEKIHSVCAKFATDFEKACTINVLSLTEEERMLYPDIVEVLEIGRANIYDFKEQLECLLKRIKTVNTENSLIGASETLVTENATEVVQTIASEAEDVRGEDKTKSMKKNDKQKASDMKAS